jgi:hypothetical protein
MAVGDDGWHTLDSASAVIKPSGYVTNTLSRTLLQYDIKEIPEVVSKAIVRSQTETKYRKQMVRPLLYRDKYQHTSDPHTVLARMLRKYVGKAHELSVVHSQADEYFSVVSQFESFNERVHCDVLTEIVKEVFEIFTPGGKHLFSLLPVQLL